MLIGSPFSIIFVQFSMQIKRLVMPPAVAVFQWHKSMLSRWEWMFTSHMHNYLTPYYSFHYFAYYRSQVYSSGIVFSDLSYGLLLSNHWADPGVFPGFNFCIFSFTICGVILKESKYPPKNAPFGVIGMPSNRSSADVLLRNELNVPALSFAVVASEPSVFLRGSILLRVLILVFKYDQNFLGEVMMFSARLFSKFNLSILVKDQFLTLLSRVVVISSSSDISFAKACSLGFSCEWLPVSSKYFFVSARNVSPCTTNVHVAWWVYNLL